MKTYVLRVQLQNEADGRCSVWAPGMRGLASWEYTEKEVLQNIREAAEAYLGDMLDAGETVAAEGEWD